MRVTWLGWAGFELEYAGAGLVIDPLLDPAALYAAGGDAAGGVNWPEVVAPSASHNALGGLVTHLHRDHADAGALTRALAPGALVLAPSEPSRDGPDGPGLAQARHELDAAGLALRPVGAWETATLGPFTITALPAVDGTGEPQVSWAVEAGGQRIVHCGDTVFHGSWWHIAAIAGPVDLALLPINGAAVSFPWRRPASPLPAVMTPEHAAVAARLLRAARTLPMHFGGFDLEPFYRSIPDAHERFLAAAEAERIESVTAGVGETIGLPAGERAGA
jgi:L-ascorbate metabolism protein UlaG (beta-lactamase superfamily)